jgi:hypothetical protein
VVVPKFGWVVKVASWMSGPVWPEVVDAWATGKTWFAAVAAPVGSDTVPVMLAMLPIFAAPAGIDPVTAVRMDWSEVSRPSADVFRLVPAFAVTTPPVACIGVPSVVLMVVRPAAVAAPAGNGKEAALIGCVACQKVPETDIGTPLVMPWTGKPERAVTPAAVSVVFVLIEARLPPVSRASADVLRFVPALAVTEPPVCCIGEPTAVFSVVWRAAVAAPAGSGRDAAETGTALWSDATTTGWLFAAVVCPAFCNVFMVCPEPGVTTTVGSAILRLSYDMAAINALVEASLNILEPDDEVTIMVDELVAEAYPAPEVLVAVSISTRVKSTSAELGV